jgi:hypothetical protein
MLETVEEALAGRTLWPNVLFPDILLQLPDGGGGTVKGVGGGLSCGFNPRVLAFYFIFLFLPACFILFIFEKIA